MAIYLDANVFPERGSLPSLELATLIALATETKLSVCIPELVLEEVLSRYHRGLVAAQNKLLAALGEVGNYWDAPSIYLPDSEELLGKRRKELTCLGAVLPIDPIDAKDGMLREVWRRRPARDGKGGRDSAIWNGVNRHHKSLQEIGYFVSHNTKDFASADGNAWATDLAQEVADYGEPLLYIESPEKLFDELATIASVTLDSFQINDAETVVKAVIQFVEDRELYVVGAIGEKLSGAPFLVAPVSAVLKGTRQIKSYIVAGKTIAVAWTDWHLVCQVGVMRRFAHGSYGQTFYQATGDCRLQLLLRIDSVTGAPLSAEVTNSGECHLVADPLEYGQTI